MTTRLPCIYCNGSGTHIEEHDHGVTELLGCPECESTGSRPMGAAEPEVPSGDEVYIVDCGEPRRVSVFGHYEDAEAYADVIGCVEIATVQVLDHAEARRLIEREG